MQDARDAFYGMYGLRKGIRRNIPMTTFPSQKVEEVRLSQLGAQALKDWQTLYGIQRVGQNVRNGKFGQIMLASNRQSFKLNFLKGKSEENRQARRHPAYRYLRALQRLSTAANALNKWNRKSDADKFYTISHLPQNQKQADKKARQRVVSFYARNTPGLPGYKDPEQSGLAAAEFANRINRQIRERIDFKQTGVKNFDFVTGFNGFVPRYGFRGGGGGGGGGPPGGSGGALMIEMGPYQSLSVPRNISLGGNASLGAQQQAYANRVASQAAIDARRRQISENFAAGVGPEAFNFAGPNESVLPGMGGNEFF